MSQLPVAPICLGDVLVDLFQASADLCEIRSPSKGEVEIFGETVVAEVAAFERGAAFEYEKLSELTLTQSGGIRRPPCSLRSRFAKRERLRYGIMCDESPQVPRSQC